MRMAALIVLDDVKYQAIMDILETHRQCAVVLVKESAMKRSGLDEDRLWDAADSYDPESAYVDLWLDMASDEDHLFFDFARNMAAK
jgi:hypothetical protein